MTSRPNYSFSSLVPNNKQMNKKFFKKPVFWLSLLVAVLLAITGGLLAYMFFNKPSNGYMTTSSQQNSTATIINNGFAQHAQDIGAKKCAALYSYLGDAVTNGSTADLLYYGTKSAPDENPIGALAGQVYPTINGRGTGVVFASPTVNGCAGVVTKTILQMEACSQIAKKLPEGSERLRDLTATAVFRLPNNFNVMLMPASENSCIVVSSLSLTDKVQ